MSFNVPQLYQPRRLMDSVNQGNALLQELMQTQAMPQQIKNQLALQAGQAQQAQNQAKYGIGQYGAILTGLNNPNIPDDQKNALKTALTINALYRPGMPNDPTAQAVRSGVISQDPSLYNTVQAGSGQTPQQLYDQQNQQYQSKTAQQNATAAKNNVEAQTVLPTQAAKNISQASLTNTQNVNEGGTTTALSSDLAPLQQQLQGMQDAQAKLPSGNFMGWNSSDQNDYISKNDVAPPLPNGTAITKKIDPKTEARINGLAPTAQSIQFMKENLGNPDVQKYIGNSVQAKANRVMANAAILANKPLEDYKNYLAFKASAQTLVNDTISTTQTGSRSFGMMQQFLKVFDPDSQTTPGQAKQSLDNAANILYGEGLTYVGGPYEPGLRNAAFNGVKLLNNMGYGKSSSNTNNSTAGAPPPGLNRDQYKAWIAKNGGGL